MKLRQLPLFLLLIAALSSCNVVHMGVRRDTKAMEKAGLKAYTFTDAAGPHYVWSSTKPGSADDGRPKLMLVHGITSQSLMWARNVKDLSAHYDLIIPDLIGHGHSTARWTGNSVNAQTAHLDQILDSLKIEQPVNLVGGSYGGAIAANFAEQYPERVKKLVIYDGPASDYTRAMADSVARSVGAAGIKDLFEPKDPEGQRRLISLVTYKPMKVPRFALHQLYEAMKDKMPNYSSLLQDLLDRAPQYEQKTYRWPMPVYVFWGAGDRLIPISVGRGIVARNHLPADHFLVIPQAGHSGNVEQPEWFNAHLMEVLGK
ncbi:MAG: alpha/beta hydrolase [Flavobacteriales bacterium]|nr:alpha/beta hydrolase [Flavobacteriales bacterium]MCL4281596.1 alpha/beta hydrolase [Flavobacteriales bacterium]